MYNRKNKESFFSDMYMVMLFSMLVGGITVLSLNLVVPDPVRATPNDCRDSSYAKLLPIGVKFGVKEKDLFRYLEAYLKDKAEIKKDSQGLHAVFNSKHRDRYSLWTFQLNNNGLYAVSLVFSEKYVGQKPVVFIEEKLKPTVEELINNQCSNEGRLLYPYYSCRKDKGAYLNIDLDKPLDVIVDIYCDSIV